MRLYSKRRFHQAKPSHCLRCVEASSQSGWTKAMVSIENVFYLFCAPIKCLAHLWRSKIFVASPCDLECLLLSRCSSTSSNTCPSQTCVPSGLLWQHPGAHICQDAQRLRGSQCIHFTPLPQAVVDYYLTFYEWSAILTATVLTTRQLQQDLQLQYILWPNLDFIWIMSFTDSLKPLLVLSTTQNQTTNSFIVL